MTSFGSTVVTEWYW